MTELEAGFECHSTLLQSTFLKGKYMASWNDAGDLPVQLRTLENAKMKDERWNVQSQGTQFAKTSERV